MSINRNQYNAFLWEVACDLYEKFGANNQLANITIVAPSKRTRLFLNRYFTELSGKKPIWSPKYATSARLFKEASDLKIYDEQVQQITLVHELYRAYSDVRKEKQFDQTETFDKFYFFGEILLHDFNDIDKNLVSAESIYRNISDLQRMENWDFLNDNQKELLVQFLHIKFDTKLSQNFSDIWNILAEVYTVFKQRLREKNIAYEGMLMRDVIDMLETGDAPSILTQTCVFVGFNRLSKAEEKLFKALKNESLFYWDYDEYLNDFQEVEPVRQYLKAFPDNRKNINRSHFKNEKKIEFVESPTAVSQAGYISEWLAKTPDYPNFDTADTAIVLCDEKILPAVLSNIPKEITPNIAILYSLMQSQTANLLIQLLELQVKGVRKSEFDFAYRQPVLRNYFIGKISDTANEDKEIFAIYETSQDILLYLRRIIERIGEANFEKSDLEKAAISESYKMLNKLQDIVSDFQGEEKLSKEILLKLVRRLLLSVKISCSGEPASGLQVLALSDTRNMDFKNLLVLSANDGIMPKIDSETSFIPPFLRHAFGLPSIEEQDSQETCHFYRLIQRAENISLMYNAGKSATNKGEKSRYLLQLEKLSPHKDKIEFKSLENNLSPSAEIQEIRIEKDSNMLEKLREKYDGNTENDYTNALSPSAFNAYIDCPLRFYFRYVAGIKKPDDNAELNSAILGSIVHKTMELIYSIDDERLTINNAFFNAFIVGDDLTHKTQKHIQQAFELEYFKTPTKIEDYNGEQKIYFKVIKKMIISLLRRDQDYAPFEILEQEENHYSQMALDDKTEICVGGRIDRIDSKNGKTRVVDYKTGSPPKKDDYADKIEDIFKTEGRKKKAGYQFQTFLYSSILWQNNFCAELPTPALLFPLADDADYSPELKLDYEDLTAFETAFKEKLKELFDLETPFTQCEKIDTCKYCDFAGICRRE